MRSNEDICVITHFSLGIIISDKLGMQKHVYWKYVHDVAHHARCLKSLHNVHTSPITDLSYIYVSIHFDTYELEHDDFMLAIVYFTLHISDVYLCLRKMKSHNRQHDFFPYATHLAYCYLPSRHAPVPQLHNFTGFID